MPTILSKGLASLLALILAVVTPPTYIELGTTQLDYSFKNGDNYPVFYYLRVTNIGPQKANFIISANVDWLAVYRDDEPVITSNRSVELERQSNASFILEIDHHRLPDGKNTTEVTLEAVNIIDYTTMDTQKVTVNVYRNTPIPTPTPTTAPASPTPEPTVSLEVTPSTTSTPTVLATATPLPVVSLIPTRPVVRPTPVPLKTRRPEASSLVPSFQRGGELAPSRQSGLAPRYNPATSSWFELFLLFLRNLFI